MVMHPCGAATPQADPGGAEGLCGLDGALLVVVDTSSEGDEDEILQKERLWEGLCARELPVVGRVHTMGLFMALTGSADRQCHSWGGFAVL